ncbi:MAG: GNAT family N-acetyltransferase [Hyphomicrobiales bacterium]|nr:GNAT family N-acetyltransferase [Hyphomicrobiales bacterium]
MRLFRKYEFHVSEARIEDYSFLENIHAQGFDRAWSVDELAATLAGKGTKCFVANIHGEGSKGPKGFVIIRTLAGQSEVLTIAIDKAFRKRGIARLLLEYVIRTLQADRVEQLFLEVSEHNVAALGLYKSLSFKQVSQRRAYYRIRPDNNQGMADQKGNALVMQLELR